MIRRFQATQLSDRALSRVQDEARKVFDDITARPGVDHILLKGVQLLAASVTHVAHLLGRPLVGWQVVRLRGSATVWDAQDANTSPGLHLDLHTSADVVADLLVF